MNKRCNEVYEHILSAVLKMPVIDTHEHLPIYDKTASDESNSDASFGDIDLLATYLTHYMSSDLVSSGLKPEDLAKARDASIPSKERWRILEPYWEACRYTGYGRALDIAVTDIYRIDGIRGDTIEALNDKFREANGRSGHIRYVLKDLCGIRLSILHSFAGRFECDRSLYRKVWCPTDSFVFKIPAKGCESIPWTEESYGIRIQSLDSWMDAFRFGLEDALKNGIVGLKNTLAYIRSLRFEKVDYGTAKELFEESFSKWENSGRAEGKDLFMPKPVQDFMMHFILKEADERGLVMQIHTGLQEGNGNDITNSNPSHLLNLFRSYPNVKFDIFHIGYPYQSVLSAISKNFPNVFIDMCWAHIISPAASAAALNDFLDAVPYTKISAFGGDYLFPDGVYGHLRLARETVSRVLAEKVCEGIFSPDKALEIAHNLFYDNPVRIFDLDLKE